MKTLTTVTKSIFVISAIILLATSLTACKKEAMILVGRSYHIKGDIFNKGSYQPTQPVRVDSLYTDASTGLPYAKCKAQIAWDKFALKPGNGVAQQIVDGNLIMLEQLKSYGIEFGDSYLMTWSFPQEDLK
jgi:hypothetical protein